MRKEKKEKVSLLMIKQGKCNDVFTFLLFDIMTNLNKNTTHNSIRRNETLVWNWNRKHSWFYEYNNKHDSFIIKKDTVLDQIGMIRDKHIISGIITNDKDIAIIAHHYNYHEIRILESNNSILQMSVF